MDTYRSSRWARNPGRRSRLIERSEGEMTISSDDRRLQRLEDIEAIRKLKARYLNACDQKDPARVRSCFANGRVVVDCEYRGVFGTADEFVAYYTGAACHDFVFDKHQAGNAEIDIVDDNHA